MPFVSVIVPCYNAAEHINRCLEAFERQTFSDFNVLFIDDASSDNTVEVIETFAQKHTVAIKVLKNEKNAGPGFSRNRGIAEADGEYIAFCDSDDWYDDGYLFRMVEAAKENDADMVFCNSKKVLPNGKEMRIEVFRKENTELNPRSILLFGVDSLCSIMVKRAIVCNVPQPDIRNGEDMAVIPLLILNSKTFNIVDEPIYNYLCRPGSLSCSATEKVTESLIESYTFICKNKKDGFEREIEFIGVKNLVYGALLNHYKCSKDNHKADDILKAFEAMYPDCYKNRYIRTLPIYKRVFVFCAEKRLYFALKLLSAIHEKILNAG